MMRPSGDLARVYLCRQAVDFRKGIYIPTAARPSE
jgi:hypothetical protein